MFLGYIWSAPNTLIGLLLAVFYRPTAWRWDRGVLTALGGKRIWGRPAGQTWGWLIYFSDERARSREDLQVHERVHVRQGMIGGPLFLLAYGVHFLFLWVRYRFDWKRAYFDVWAEKQAYRAQRGADV